MADSSRSGPKPPAPKDEARAAEEPARVGAAGLPASAADAPRETGRSYDDSEIAAVLERASQLQRGEPARAVPATQRPGLTLEELEVIASEAGIDPTLVRRAAGEVAGRAAARQSHSALLGGPSRLSHERSVVGHLTEVELAALAERIRHELGELGELELAGSTLSWRSGNGRRVVKVLREGPATRVAVELEVLGGAIFGGALGGLGGGLGGAAAAAALALGGSLLLGAVLFAGGLAGGFVALRLGFAAHASKEAATSQRLLDALVAQVARVAHPAPRQ